MTLLYLVKSQLLKNNYRLCYFLHWMHLKAFSILQLMPLDLLHLMPFVILQLMQLEMVHQLEAGKSLDF
jgi:hypothetical protein